LDHFFPISQTLQLSISVRFLFVRDTTDDRQTDPKAKKVNLARVSEIWIRGVLVGSETDLLTPATASILGAACYLLFTDHSVCSTDALNLVMISG
jgi:hypothetical protein